MLDGNPGAREPITSGFARARNPPLHQKFLIFGLIQEWASDAGRAALALPPLGETVRGHDQSWGGSVSWFQCGSLGIRDSTSLSNA